MSTTPTVARSATPLDVIALQYANPTRLVTIPVGILVAVVVVMTAITLAVVSNGGSGADLDYNGSVVWSLFGFVVAIGVQAVSIVFPLALALGSTRRAFTLGVLATAALQAALLTVGSLALLGLETLSGGWFVGARVFSDSTLGGGNPLTLIAVMFLASLTALTVGGLFGASWIRFGSRGPMGLGIGLSVVVVLALLLLFPEILAAARAFETWWLAVAAVVVVALSTVGEYLLLRRASVR
jgi:hypothetical protein